MTTKQYVLEWSKKSNGFHIQPLEHTLGKNQERFLDDTSHDWMVLMIGSNETCQAMADNHRHRLYERTKPMNIIEAMHAAI